MNRSLAFRQSVALKSVVIAGGLCAGAWRAEAAVYSQTDLVSDIPGLAIKTDPELLNSWGVSRITTPFSTPFWISNQAAQTTTLYSVTGSTNISKVDINPPSGFVGIPTTASGPQGPTGQVSNSSSNFSIAGGPALFMFANLNGTISAWSGGVSSTIVVPASGASYTGLAINSAQNMIYAANGAGTGSIDVFDSTFTRVTLPGAFANPFPGMVPFNVQDIGGSVYVTYAPPGHAGQTGAALGQGGVAKFSETGVLEQMMSGGQLAAPWGVALAPADFGLFSNDLLVGNFSYLHSEINAFDPTTGMFEGSIPIDDGPGNTNGGLWALTFGGGGNNGDPNILYFTEGLNGERDGLFAALSVPEPSTWALMLLGLAGLGLAARRRRTPLPIV